MYLEKLFFDSRFNVNTSFVVEKEALDFEGRLRQNSKRYRPTPIFELIKVFKRLKKIEPNIVDSTFIDYGCGTGRVLFVGSNQGFKSMLGVELSPKLVEVGESNIKNFRKKYPSYKISIVKENAEKFIPALDVRCCFFYCPFSQVIFDKVLNNILESCNREARVIYIITFRYDYTFNEDWVIVWENTTSKIRQLKPTRQP